MSVGVVLKDPHCSLVAEVAPIADARGFSHLLFTELSVPGAGPITGRDPFVLASIALAASERLRSGTAVTGTPFHTPRHMALRAATLQEQSGGRFVLGCGVAHKGFADLLGVAYPSAPVAHARAYCDELRSISKALAFGAELTVWLAALGDKMAATGAAHADGIILNWVSPEWTRRTVERAVQATGRRPTVAVLLRVAPGAALERAAQHYLDALPNYANHFARQGLDSATAVVGAATGGPGDDPTRLAARIAAYREAGADVVCVYPADIDDGSIVDIVSTTPIEETGA